MFAHLDAAGKPALAVFQNDTSAIAAGKGRLIVRHAAAAPAVDVKANGAVAFTNLANGKEAKADLAVGTVKAEVVPTGAATPVVIGPADLPIAEGSALIVYATGALDAGLQVVTETITGLGPTPTAVQTGDSPVSQGRRHRSLAGGTGQCPDAGRRRPDPGRPPGPGLIGSRGRFTGDEC